MGRSSQAKGRLGERELSALLNEKGYSTRPGAPVSFGGEPDVLGLPGVHIEVKRRECADIPAALRKAAQDAEYFSGGEDIPVVFTRGNGQHWRAVMDLEAFLRFYRHTDFLPPKEGTQ